MISLQQLYDVEERAMRAKAEAARYRAALVEVLDKVELVPPKHDSFPDQMNFLEVNVIDAIWDIAHRALHPEEEG